MSIEEIIEQSNKNEVSQLKDSLKRYVKKWPWVIMGAIVALIIAGIRLQFTPEQYSVASSIQVKKSQQANNPTDLLFGARYSNRFMGIQDEIKIIKSYPILRETVESLQFDVVYSVDDGFRRNEVYKTSPFTLEYDRKDSSLTVPYGIEFIVQTIDENQFRIRTEQPYRGQELDEVHRFGEQIQFNNFSFSLETTSYFNVQKSTTKPYYIKLYKLDNIAYAYKNLLTFEEVESFSKILTMKMKTRVPDKTIDFMNTLISKYIEQNLVEKNEAAKRTVEFIDRQLESISDSLNKKEKNLEDFKASAELSSLSIEGKVLIEKYNELESEKAKYEVMQQYFDYLKESLRSREDKKLNNLIAPSAFGIDDQVINELVMSLLELNITEKNLIAEGNTKSPLLHQIQTRKDELISALEESVQNLSNANQIILNNLNERTDNISQNAQKLPSTERHLVNLNRLLKLNEKIYLFLMEKRSTAAISMSSNTPDCKVIEPAMLNPQSPIAPKKKMVYLIHLILGIFIPLSIIVFLDFLNDTVKSKKDIESITKAPIIGLIPKEKTSGGPFVALDKPMSVLAESFRIIRTNLSFYQKTRESFAILVTSTVAQEGKTFCAINLASVLAASGKKTVLLGFDLRKPKIHSYLGEQNNVGISNFLTGHAALKDIIQPTRQDNLHIIHSGPVPPNPAELITESRTAELISELKHQYDYIILDSPPVGIVTDALILKDFSDLNLYVVRQGYSKREFVTRINELYTSGTLPNLSIMLNDADKSTRYGSGYYVDYDSKSLGKRVMDFKKS